MTGPTRDVFQLELEKRGVVQAVTNEVSGGIDLIGPDGEAITQEDLGFSASIGDTLRSAVSTAVGLAFDAPKLSDPAAWTTGQAVVAPVIRSNNGKLYIARSNGTCGATAPTHTTPTAVSDGTVSWLYLGPAPSGTVAPDAGPTVNATSSVDAGLTNIYYPATNGAGRITVLGGEAIVYQTTAVQPRTYQSKPDNTKPIAGGVHFSFYTDAPHFAISGSGSFNVEVDGRMAGFGAFANSASPHFLHVNFGTAGPRIRRRVVVHGNKDLWTFRGVYVDPNSQIWPYTPSCDLRVGVISDSIIAGAENGPHCAGNVFSYRLGQRIGCPDTWNFSAGGTGYIAQNASDYYTFEGRLPQVLDKTPDVLFVIGSINEVAQTAGAVTAAVESFIAAARSQGFTGPIVGVGVIPKNAAGVSALEAAIAAGYAGKAGCYFIPMFADPSGPWITGAWNNSANTNSTNATAYIGADGTHPVDIGTAYLADRTADAFIADVLPLL